MNGNETQKANGMIDISPKERILLSGIRSRPPMYIGDYSLSKLWIFLMGYGGALRNHALDDQCCIMPKGFNDFVLKKYNLYPSSMGGVRAILQNMPDGKEAIEAFFNLLDEFLEANGLEKIQRL
ncbi:MAG: hypothetical protein HDR14_03415 [Lachnospiraceae bacterium]|nr:hypothetical protein [Lachnospiraceae bacterium]